MVKNGICLGGASKQNAPFLKKFAPENALMPRMSRIGPVRALKAFIKPFETPQRSVKIKI